MGKTVDNTQWQKGDLFYLTDYSVSFIRDHTGLISRSTGIKKGSKGIFLEIKQNPSKGMKFLTHNWAKVLVAGKICYIPFLYMSQDIND